MVDVIDAIADALSLDADGVFVCVCVCGLEVNTC